MKNLNDRWPERTGKCNNRRVNRLLRLWRFLGLRVSWLMICAYMDIMCANNVWSNVFDERLRWKRENVRVCSCMCVRLCVWVRVCTLPGMSKTFIRVIASIWSQIHSFYFIRNLVRGLELEIYKEMFKLRNVFSVENLLLEALVSYRWVSYKINRV